MKDKSYNYGVEVERSFDSNYRSNSYFTNDTTSASRTKSTQNKSLPKLNKRYKS
jgi:hypothetical protein